MGKYGNFQIGVDLPADTLHQLQFPESPWPGILKGLLGVAHGLGVPGPEDEANRRELDLYRQKQEVAAQYRQPKQRQLYRSDGDGGVELIGSDEQNDTDPRLEVGETPTVAEAQQPLAFKVPGTTPDPRWSAATAAFDQQFHPLDSPPNSGVTPEIGVNVRPRGALPGGGADIGMRPIRRLAPGEVPAQNVMDIPVDGAPIQTPNTAPGATSPRTATPSPTQAPSPTGTAPGAPSPYDGLISDIEGRLSEAKSALASLQSQRVTGDYRVASKHATQIAALKTVIRGLESDRAKQVFERGKAAMAPAGGKQSAHDMSADALGQAMPAIIPQIRELSKVDPSLRMFDGMKDDQIAALAQDPDFARTIYKKVMDAHESQQKETLDAARLRTLARGHFREVYPDLPPEAIDLLVQKSDGLYAKGMTPEDLKTIFGGVKKNVDRANDQIAVVQARKKYVGMANERGWVRKGDEETGQWEPLNDESSKDYIRRMDKEVTLRTADEEHQRSRDRDEQFNTRMEQVKVTSGFKDLIKAQTDNIEDDEKAIRALQEKIGLADRSQGLTETATVKVGPKGKQTEKAVQQPKAGTYIAGLLDKQKASLKAKIDRWNDFIKSQISHRDELAAKPERNRREEAEFSALRDANLEQHIKTSMADESTDGIEDIGDKLDGR